MNTGQYHIMNDRGFTLLEIIITLVVAAILGTMLTQYMNTSLKRSAEPITLIQKTFSLNRIMEEMTADYHKLLETDSSPLTTLDTNILSNKYGQYAAQTGFITFSGGNETAGGDRILKATITANNQSITVLFTK